MTQRLIDADALKEYIDCGHLRNPCEVCFSERDVVDLIDAQPIIDAEPVTHGRWLKSKESDDKGASCSVCKITFGISDFELLENFQYCPCCGARMDEHD